MDEDQDEDDLELDQLKAAVQLTRRAVDIMADSENAAARAGRRAKKRGLSRREVEEAEIDAGEEHLMAGLDEAHDDLEEEYSVSLRSVRRQLDRFITSGGDLEVLLEDGTRELEEAIRVRKERRRKMKTGKS